MRRLALAAAALITTLSVTGCADYKGINSLTLPGTVGTDSDSYQVTMTLKDAANMVPNTPVLINDTTVGTVTKVALDGWTPVLTLSLRKDIQLPANATASLAQTSLLGSKHVALGFPSDQPPHGTLEPGARIPEERSKRFPQTEEVLAGVSLLLNGGGLQHVQTITTELNRALGNGRDKDAREFLTQLDGFATGLDKQRNDIVSAMKGLDRFSTTLAPRMDDIEHALKDMPDGLKVLDQQEPQLVKALGSLSRAEDEFKALHADNVGHVLNDMEPVLQHVGDVQDGNTMKALKQIPFVTFPLDSIPRAFRGDWVHIWLTLDLTHEALDQAFLTGTPAAGSLATLAKLQGGKIPSIPELQAGNPLTLPLGVPDAPKAPPAAAPAPVGKPDGDPLGKPLKGLGG